MWEHQVQLHEEIALVVILSEKVNNLHLNGVLNIILY